ncbi:hypothetical protein [Xanthobacter agilis]|uniref:AcrR family transcriptional regulator n=1 Tax=Xanthobacter agilis TaxID=47492 RepID=A0ABU0LHK9_XANAG|nr:hypothetical protein [Xanthobacter agilis]MDQ0506567.1 AcrR family transcriptional regulator [Xanthobacter agilis]
MAAPPPRRQTPASAGLARRLYAEGVPIAEICARTGLSTGAAYHWIDREVDADGTIRVAPIGRRASKTFLPRPDTPPRTRLLARLWRAAERQVADIEARVENAAPREGGGAPPRLAADAEKDARALALIARTVRELVAAEDDAADKPRKDADDTVRDLDEFRRELARRLERLREDDTAPGDPLPS